MDINYIIIFLAIVLEIGIRLYPSKYNFSILDNIKILALKVHELIDLMIPNAKKE